jgi:pSer/pThr/pTyr-binding forkhead associated (FHA) protein
VADLVRIDGGKSESHLLGKRTRVGRATGCELHVDSSSVSRHHALILVGPRDILIEDLNSTNGVYINGRKASRQVLNDGDTLTIGEAIFRLSAKQQPRHE